MLPKASPTFTGTVSGITATVVGLANVNNTSDANKPISTAELAQLSLLSPIASPTFTGSLTAPTINAISTLQINGVSVTQALFVRPWVCCYVAGSASSPTMANQLGLYTPTSITKGTTGKYIITFQTAPTANFNVWVTPWGSNPGFAQGTAVSTTQITVETWTTGGVLYDAISFMFSIIAQ